MSELRIRCRPNGPLLIEGSFTLVDHEGNAFALPTNKPAIALCRCGQSKKKPFCDGTHKECGFVAMELAIMPDGPPAGTPPAGAPPAAP